MPPRKKQPVATASSTETNVEPVVEAPKPKATRQKKTAKHQVVAVVTPDGIQGTFSTDTKRPLIAHLPIHSSDITFHDEPFRYNPNPPTAFEAFDVSQVDPFSTEATYENAPQPDQQMTNAVVETAQESSDFIPFSDISIQQKPVPVVQHTQQVSRKEYGPTKLLVAYASSNTSKTLPEESNVACFWCCEHFSGRPCVIPTQIVEDTWHVYGNFCAPQCAMAYLLSEQLDTHTRWERIALLNRLYSSSCHGRVYPAPSRESLQRFGGPISPEDFHAICSEQRIRVDIHMPPMVSILASMDTKPIDFYETPLRNTFASPYQMNIVRPTDEPKGLKLKRNKPLKDKENTLDVCLQIAAK
jgi:hypothetical protein